jgi:ribose 5-phosphate isomerase RpiB
LVDIWLNTVFAGGRHARRIDKIGNPERESGEKLFRP